MKTIIAGSRSISLTPEKIDQALEEFKRFKITEVVCGLAPGMDLSGKTWAKSKGIPVKEFPADWGKHGKSAGIIRNKQMGDYADALFYVWDGESDGTRHMLKYMNDLGKQTYGYQIMPSGNAISLVSSPTLKELL